MLNITWQHAHLLCRGFFTPKIVGTFYMQEYKVKEKTAIVPPVSKLSGHPAWEIHGKYMLNITWEYMYCNSSVQDF
jgi:hypothetical protein